MAKLFFSYSHKDEALRDELEVHLAILQRQGLVQVWYDRRISAGQEFAGIIDSNLKDADIVLLLVSPYFLHSNYCYDIEMQEALKRHELGLAVVIPVILDPCDWRNTPFGKLLALPKDGKPISKYPNQHDAFMEVVDTIRQAATTPAGANNIQLASHAAPPPVMPLPIAESAAPPRSSNLRVRKNFSEREKDDFLEDAFEYMANFFEGSLAELERRNTTISTRFKRIDTNHFAAFVYENGKAISECKIWLATRGSFMHGIVYASNAGSNDDSFNDSMSVAEDGYMLGLKTMGISYMGIPRNGDEMLTPQGGAEHYWAMLIQRLQ